ncbi:MAG: hypothetical protein GX595_20955, partial [Lentisphaerae bacterium]|nr:hypothetical protein [Lentisphaerota bacterium]
MAFAQCVEGVLGATSLRQRAGGGWLWASSRVFGAAAFLLVSAAVLRAAEDLVEFDRVEAAADFGWQASGGGALTAAAESAVGRFALQVTGVDGREYQGIRLRHDIDLTGARPDDVIVLHVKQNASDSVCVNLRLGEAHVYRYAPVTRGAWTRVVLDLDPGRWVNPKNVPWGLVPSLSVYTKGFDRADEVFLIDGFSVTVAGQAAAAVRGMADPTAWTFPQETAEAWLIGDADAAWAIERASGRVVGGWNVRTAQRYLAGATGRYHVEDRASLVTADEAADRVVAADVDAGAQRLTLRCVNEAIPGFTIEKRYTLDGHRLLRRLAFELDEPRGRFVTYNAAVDLTPRFRDGGYYMHGLGALVPAPDVAATTRSERKGSPKLMLLHQPAAGYGFAHYRTHTNDRFVWPFFTGSIAGFLERMNVLSYTPRGWEMSMGTMPLQGGTGAASYGEAFSVFPGTWFDFFDREYRHLEPVQEALAAVPPVPSWVGDVVLYSGLPDMAHVRRLVEMTDEGTIVVLVSHWGSWADYRVDECLVGQDGGFMDGPELKDLVARLHALSPRVKVCLYNLLWSATYEARTLAAHPEWFRHRNKDGQPLDFFPGCAPNYASLLSVPACYDELLRQCDLQFAYLDVDLLYLDIGCAVN